MEKSRVSLRARATGADLTLVVRFDGEEIYRCPHLASDFQDIAHEFDDSQEREHTVEIEMLGKIQDHTQVNESGDIISDQVIEIEEVALDDITLGHLLTEVAEYHHDHNGTGDPMQERFYGTMGCNGVVRFRFTSPMYLWLLEKM
jgi:hypothetical protein